jgi:arachidonate 15-lipoxygenase
MTLEGTIPDRKSLLSFLPPSKQTADQLSILFILSAYRYDRLGYYDDKFLDPEAQDVLAKFQQELNEAEREIELNNKSRLINYNYLKPRLVTNSISV